MSDEFDHIVDAPFDAALSERYLVYALSTITARSLPAVRDGLKPVHRRLLWAMRLLRLDPAGAYKKSARVVGDVIGKYHPHGDQSVYDAMVRLAQDFALRYPLVDGQGNFGNIDGDNAAELIDAAAHLIDNPKADDRALMDFVAGPDFPTGGVLVDSRESIASAYATGRGSFRLRARVEIEREKGGGWHLLVSEMPYGVQKSKLIEQIAQLIADKKLPILADVKDESDEQVRLILEPRARTVD